MKDILGERIKTRRISKGLSQAQLAELLEGYTSRSSISKVEKGVNNLTQSKIVEFAAALDTTPAYLMGWTDDPYDYTSDPNGLLDNIPNEWLRAWREDGLSNAEMWGRYTQISSDSFEENKKAPDTFIDVEDLSEDKRYLVEKIMSLSDDEVRGLRAIVDQVLQMRGK